MRIFVREHFKLLYANGCILEIIGYKSDVFEVTLGRHVARPVERHIRLVGNASVGTVGLPLPAAGRLTSFSMSSAFSLLIAMNDVSFYCLCDCLLRRCHTFINLCVRSAYLMLIYRPWTY